MKGIRRAEPWRRVALAAALGALSLPPAYPFDQHHNPSPHPAPAQHQAQQSHPQASHQQPREQYQGHSNPQPQNRPYTPPSHSNSFVPQPQNRPPAAQPQVHPYPQPQGNVRPVYPGTQYPAQNATRSTHPTYPATNYAPPGHLQSWLNQNRNVPVRDQEKMLRSDPSFKSLPQGQQQRSSIRSARSAEHGAQLQPLPGPVHSPGARHSL